MSRTPRILIALTAVFCTGCTTLPEPEMENAVLLNPSPETRAEITRVISKALGGRSVTIAPESFTTSSRLIIEPKIMFRSGYPVQSRDAKKPDHFYLKTSNGTCRLYHQQTENLFDLDIVKCRKNPEI